MPCVAHAGRTKRIRWAVASRAKTQSKYPEVEDPNDLGETSVDCPRDGSKPRALVHLCPSTSRTLLSEVLPACYLGPRH